MLISRRYATKLDWTNGPLAEGLQRHQEGAYFAAHEAWESVWLHAEEPAKTFLQALIQTTAACYHLQRKNWRGASRLLTAALDRLEGYPHSFGGICVGSLRDDIRTCQSALTADEPKASVMFVRIVTL